MGYYIKVAFIKTMPKTYTHPITKKTYTLKQWAAWLDVEEATLAYRLSNCRPEDLAAVLTSGYRAKPPGLYRNPATGEERTAYEWAIALGISPDTFWGRVGKYGLNDPRLFLPKSRRGRKGK